MGRRSLELALALAGLAATNAPAGAQELVPLGKHKGAVLAVAVSPDGRRAVSGGLDRKLVVWNLESGSRERDGAEHPRDVSALALTGDGRFLVTAGGDGQLR